MIVVPVTISIRLQLNQITPEEANSRLERTIRRAYRERDKHLNDEIKMEACPETEIDKSEIAGDIVEWKIRTFGPLLSSNLSTFEGYITRAVEREFDHDIRCRYFVRG